MADFLDVNLSTISKAYKLCEQKGSYICGSRQWNLCILRDAATDPVFLCETDNTPIIKMGAIVPFVTSNQKVKQHLESLLKKPDALNLLSYGVPDGTKRHREAGVSWMQKSGFNTDSNHIVLAAGGQNALLAALGALFSSGDKIGTDSLTYPGIKTAAKNAWDSSCTHSKRKL